MGPNGVAGGWNNNRVQTAVKQHSWFCSGIRTEGQSLEGTRQSAWYMLSRTNECGALPAAPGCSPGIHGSQTPRNTERSARTSRTDREIVPKSTPTSIPSMSMPLTHESGSNLETREHPIPISGIIPRIPFLAPDTDTLKRSASICTRQTQLPAPSLAHRAWPVQ